ncbi:MAG: fatty acyl-AMP ligase [Candidatus Sericytochromatia bacterium]|nr:fatty acyl-AMP ligase [Candidatus Sericytochromatia bacterium]
MSQLLVSCLDPAKNGEEIVYAQWHENPDKRLQLSGTEVLKQVEAVAASLAKRYPPQSRILLLFEPGLEFPLAFWACLRAGMVAIPTFPPADPRTRTRFLGIAEDAQAVAVLTSSPLLKLSKWVKWLVGSLRRMHWHALEDLAAEVPQGQGPALPSENDLALLQYTSGSTGSPRGVMLSHGNVYANLLSLVAPWQTMPAIKEHIVSWLPLYHDMGLMAGIVFPRFINARATTFSPLYFLQKPKRWLMALSETQGTISCAPNFAFGMCLKKISEEQLAGLDLRHWRISLNGAEAINPETLERFAERFAPCGFKNTAYYNAYGMAETAVFVTGGKPLNTPVVRSFEREALSQHHVVPSPEGRVMVGLGQSWADTQLCIVDPETCQRLGPTQVGEIWIQGGSVGLGYWRRPEETQATFAAEIAAEPTAGKWLRSGDLGFIFEGDLFITGRRKELIILQGQNHSPPVIEQAVQTANTHFRTGCGAAFSVGESPEKLILVQEVRNECPLSASELEAIARKALAEAEGLHLDELVLVETGSLPKTSSGKIQRNLCQNVYLKGKLKKWKKR